MKKVTIVGLAMILMLMMAACSANNTSGKKQTIENEVVEAPIVKEDESTEEHVVEQTDEAKPAVEPEAAPVIEAEVIVTEVESKPEVVQSEKVEPEKVEPQKVEEEQPAVVEPAPVVVAPKIHKVEIVNFAFSPVSLEISVGDIVEFTNLDAVKHSVVEDDGVFDTGLLAKDKSKQITFSDAGEFGYFCGPHPSMRAAIVVK